MTSFSFTTVLAIVMIFYVIVMFAISVWAQGRIKNSEDYIVAGRKLPLSLAWATILATWFGAATVVNQSDEVRQNGLQMAALDPIGAGLCLIVAGLFFAVPLWKMGLLTISDFFRVRFGKGAELMSACIMVPSYFGWIAAQFVALAKILSTLYGGDFHVWMLIVAAVGMSYTLLGGMWSVTLTDAIQICLVLLGLVILGIVVLAKLGQGSWLGGIELLIQEFGAEKMRLMPTGSQSEFALWLGALGIGILGNIPGQDLMQRVFAAKSAATARWACILSGLMYLAFGMIPVMLALASLKLIPSLADNVTSTVGLLGSSMGQGPCLAVSIMPLPGRNEEVDTIITTLAQSFLHPLPFTIFLLALLSAILSTIDSAILSPASVLSQNVFERINRGRLSSFLLNRFSVVLVTACSLGMAFWGQSAYELLEGAYELTMVGLFVPLAFGLYLKSRGQAPGLAAMIVGTGIWLLHYLAGIAQVSGYADFGLDWELTLGFLPLHRALFATLAAALVYLALHKLLQNRLPNRQAE